MDYRLVVLTHGDNAPLAATLRSFNEQVKPKPVDAVMVYDGTGIDFLTPEARAITPFWTSAATNGPVGFCGATSLAWKLAAEEPGPNYIFWLENDFTFNREVDLDIVAAVLDLHPDLAQMALLRQPVNDEEVRHGGYLKIPARSGEYVARRDVVELSDTDGTWIEEFSWYEHRSYWTTNPSLLRRSIPATFNWPEEPRCEGVFGFELKAARPATTFGVWGEGDPWIEHSGPRTGKGY